MFPRVERTTVVFLVQERFDGLFAQLVLHVCHVLFPFSLSPQLLFLRQLLCERSIVPLNLFFLTCVEGVYLVPSHIYVFGHRFIKFHLVDSSSRKVHYALGPRLVSEVSPHLSEIPHYCMDGFVVHLMRDPEECNGCSVGHVKLKGHIDSVGVYSFRNQVLKKDFVCWFN